MGSAEEKNSANCSTERLVERINLSPVAFIAYKAVGATLYDNPGKAPEEFVPITASPGMLSVTAPETIGYQPIEP